MSSVMATGMKATGEAVGELHCRESGAGFPLVLIHGYLGAGEQWHAQLQSPPIGFRAIAPCLPGFGDSANISPPQSIAGFARVLLDFLTARGIARFILLGHSMGGMIVQEMARQAPQRVAALVLYATGALGLLPGRFETMAQSRQRVLSDGIADAASRLPAKWLTQGRRSPHYDFFAGLAAKAGLPAHLAGLTAMESWDGRAALADLACPTLIIWGDADQSYRRDQIDFLQQHIRGAELMVIPRAPHLAHVEFPHQFSSILGDFLRACDTVATSPVG